MLPHFYREYDRDVLPRIEKTVAGEDASRKGAFSFGKDTGITWTVTVSRKLGAAAVVLRYHIDGKEATDLPLAFLSTDLGTDRYSATVPLPVLTGGAECALIYYEFLFIRGADTLFTDSVNNVDFCLSEHSAAPFRLLVTEPDFKTPEWFRGGTMYHIFVDRFRRGVGAVEFRPGTEFDEDWEHGIPQYAPYPGAPLANNRFFGGNLWGVAEKLDYLCSFGVTVLYLSPIFDAASNHKYDTGDYEVVDRAFGGEAALDHLLREAKARGIRVILDGVFNHTGDDSRYFNRYGNYPGTGAYQSEDSPFSDWYRFREFPDKYDSWWGIPILPRLRGDVFAVRDYLAGKDGIAATRVRQGISGWRLDVADELSDEFLDTLRQSVHAAAPEEQPILIGEVWENAADKMAYGKRRRYFGGRQLDSVMNYPLRQGILSFVRDRDADALYHTLTELYGSYPREVCDVLMNFLGTHDTERILTVLGDPSCGADLTNEQLAHARLSPDARREATDKLVCAFTILFTVFGVPSVFYGDEAGMEGYHDPFCRLPYPWGHEDTTLVETVRRLGALRRENPCFRDGDFRVLAHTPHAIAYERRTDKNAVVTAVNLGENAWRLPLPGKWERLFAPSAPVLRGSVTLAPGETILLREV